MEESSWRLRLFFFVQAEDGIRGTSVTGVQTCALPICGAYVALGLWADGRFHPDEAGAGRSAPRLFWTGDLVRQRPDGLLERLGRKDRRSEERRVGKEGRWRGWRE